LAEALAAHLGRPLKIVPMEFSGLIPALKTGNIDLILSSMTATDERRKSIDFSNPYAFTGLALLVRKDSEIQSIEDLKNRPHHHRESRHHRRDLGDPEHAGCQARGVRRSDPPACWKSPKAGGCIHL
jgi:membrane-bound lytic murein transglycosylase MltF